jgi:hypothetical protein
MTATTQTSDQTSSSPSGQQPPLLLSPTLSLEAESALDAVITAKEAIADWQAELDRRLAALDNLVQEGTIPDKVSHAGYSCYRQEGRTTYTYPKEIKSIEAKLKQEKELAVATGTATPKVGKSFWTIREITA